MNQNKIYLSKIDLNVGKVFYKAFTSKDEAITYTDKTFREVYKERGGISKVIVFIDNPTICVGESVYALYAESDFGSVHELELEGEYQNE